MYLWRRAIDSPREQTRKEELANVLANYTIVSNLVVMPPRKRNRMYGGTIGLHDPLKGRLIGSHRFRSYNESGSNPRRFGDGE